MKALSSQKGTTLVELLAVLALAGMISGLLYTVLNSFFNTEKNVSTDALLRNEADYYIANLINYIYTLKESDVCSDNTTATPSSFINTNDINGSCTNKTGFYVENNEVSLFIDGKVMNQQNDKIQIDQSSKIEKENNIYKINLTLKYDGKTKSFVTEIHSINDLKEVENDEDSAI